jgi:hypothetical protein
MDIARDLARLEAIRFAFGASVARERRAAMKRVLRARLTSAAQVLRLHECLLAARAYPDDQATLALAERALHTFAARTDVQRLHTRLTDSGIASADIRFEFFAPTARRLAKRWPTQLELDWPRYGSQDTLTEWLPQLSHGGEWPGIDEYDYGLKGWLARLKGAHEADGAFVARMLSERLADDAIFERVHDSLGLPYVLRGDNTTPSRTNARWPAPRVHFQHAAFAGRPELAAAANTAPRAIRALSRAQGEAAVELAMRSMVTRTRDLDVFAWGDSRDVRHIDMGCWSRCTGSSRSRTACRWATCSRARCSARPRSRSTCSTRSAVPRPAPCTARYWA